MTDTNKYDAKCHACGKDVPAGEGVFERVATYQRRGYRTRRGNYKIWCKPCYNASDHSSDEDRMCGDRAYVDACARACGLDY